MIPNMQTFRPLNKTLSLNSSKDSFMLGRHNYVALIKQVKDRDAAELPPTHKAALHNKESSAQYVSGARSRIPAFLPLP